MKKIIFSFFFFQCENEKTFQKKKKLLMLKIRQKTPLLGEEAKPGNKKDNSKSLAAHEDAMMLSLPNMPGMTAATTSSGAERGFNVAREEQVRGERLFFFYCSLFLITR